ncbi:MAG: hypothetical protein ACI9R3_003225 [Verrucomicrobiales bacterium]|jgi:hypothetical protein
MALARKTLLIFAALLFWACDKLEPPPTKYYGEMIVLRCALEEYVAEHGNFPKSLDGLTTESFSNEDMTDALSVEWVYRPEVRGGDFVVISPEDANGVKIGMKRHFGLGYIYGKGQKK